MEPDVLNINELDTGEVLVVRNSGKTLFAATRTYTGAHSVLKGTEEARPWDFGFDVQDLM